MPEDLLDGRIGRTALLLVTEERPDRERALRNEAERWGFRVVTGRVGSMEAQKVVAALETACRREGLVRADAYREEHALYHAILEALQGVARGQVAFGSILRTVGLSFAVVRGPRRAGAGASTGVGVGGAGSAAGAGTGTGTGAGMGAGTGAATGAGAGTGAGGDGEWLAVALYGTIGAPVKGWEHEVCGLGVNHL
ncbi:MAG TPA: HutP family protein [Bacillota bacterium]